MYKKQELLTVREHLSAPPGFFLFFFFFFFFLWGPCCSHFYVLMSLICVVVWFYLLLLFFRLSLSSRHLLTLSFISGFSIHDCLFSFLKRLFGYSQIFLLSTIVYQNLSPQSYDKRTYMLVSNKNK